MQYNGFLCCFCVTNVGLSGKLGVDGFQNRTCILAFFMLKYCQLSFEITRKEFRAWAEAAKDYRDKVLNSEADL